MRNTNENGVFIIEIKTDQIRLLQFDLKIAHLKINGWDTVRWDLVNLKAPRKKEEVSDQFYSLRLFLFKDERTDYRFNLSSNNPSLFFIFEFDENSIIQPFKVTASQSCAAGFMDSDYHVITISMPLALQVWMEAYIGKYGELPDEIKDYKR